MKPTLKIYETITALNVDPQTVVHIVTPGLQGVAGAAGAAGADGINGVDGADAVLVWGSISGEIADQDDLQLALDAAGHDLSGFTDGDMLHVISGEFATSGLTWLSDTLSVAGPIDIDSTIVTVTDKQKYRPLVYSDGNLFFFEQTGYWNGSSWKSDSGVNAGYLGMFENEGSGCSNVGKSGLFLNIGDGCSNLGTFGLNQNAGNYGTNSGAFGLYGNSGTLGTNAGYSGMRGNAGTSCTNVGAYGLYGNSGDYCFAGGYRAGYGAGNVPNIYDNISCIGAFSVASANNQIVLGDTAISEIVSTGAIKLGDLTSLSNALPVLTISHEMPVNTEAAFTGRAIVSVADYAAPTGREVVRFDATGSAVETSFTGDVDIDGVVVVGDISGGNTATIEADGTLSLQGDATGYEDLNFSPSDGEGNKTTYPDDVTINGVFHKEFTSSNNQQCGACEEIPHSCKLGETLDLHGHIFLKSGESAGTTGVTFTIYWELRQTTGTTSGSATMATTSAALTANGHKVDMAATTDITGPTELGAQLSLRLARTAGDAGDVVVTTYGAHYQVDTPAGSRAEDSK